MKYCKYCDRQVPDEEWATDVVDGRVVWAGCIQCHMKMKEISR